MELEKIIFMIPVTKMGTEPESPEPQLRIFLHNTHVSWKALSKWKYTVRDVGGKS